MESDRELMERMKADNTDALEELILRWRERAESYAVSILHDSHLAEDAVMEAFARIYAARAEYETRYAFSTYPISRRIPRKRNTSPDGSGKTGSGAWPHWTKRTAGCCSAFPWREKPPGNWPRKPA